MNNPLRLGHATERTKTGTTTKNQIHVKDSFTVDVKETKIVMQLNILATITVNLQEHTKVSLPLIIGRQKHYDTAFKCKMDWFETKIY